MTPAILRKRAYDKPARADGYRVLVDRLWPRGIKKEDLRLDAWAKELAPSTELRKWFAHDPGSHASKRIGEILDAARPARTITLLYEAKDTEHNETVALRSLFERAAET
jgi:uncharacterized protein YeaO (DUF488 family)